MKIKEPTISQIIENQQELHRKRAFEQCLRRRFHKPYPDGYFWSVSTHVDFGSHTAKAVVGTVESTMNFVVKNPDGGGMNPCMSMGTCPFFGLTAPTIPTQTSAPAVSGVLPVTAKNIAKDGTVVNIFNLFQLIAKGLI